jgi:hypothetical protein
MMPRPAWSRLPRRLLLAVAVSACTRGDAPAPVPTSELAERLHAATQAVTDVITYDIFSPPQASRIYAYAATAAYEVLRQGDSSYRSLAGQVGDLPPIPPPPGGPVSLPLAAVRAYLTVGHALTFSRDRMDSLRQGAGARFEGEMDAATYRRSIAYGDTVARAVLAWANADRYRESRGYPKYSVTQAPGRWIPTPPAYMDAVEPNWAILRPLVLDSASEFRPPPPHHFDVRPDSPFGRELREVHAVGRGLTEAERAIAAFWDCNPYVMHVQGHTMFATKKMSPGGHWMGITRLALRQAGADPLRAAEAYARVAIALYEGFLAAWDEKYRSALIRPETVINAALDPAWQPLLQTPPFPEYPSGHSVISSAAAEVLTDLLGDGFAYVDSTEAAYGLAERRFPSFRAAAAEASISRLYGGIHFRRAIEEGQVMGRRIGEAVVSRVETRRRSVAVRGRSMPAVAAREP